MATHLVTGYAGSEHIKSEDQGSFNASFFGTGQFVMEAGNQLEASIIDNNTVRILDGDILMKGRHIRVNPDTYEDMIIENGTAGVNRCDLIVMEYSKVPETGIETATLKVLKGAATSGTASAPSYTDGDILTGAILNQMPLYKVLIEGVVLVDVVSLFDTIPTFQTLAEMYRAKFIKDCETHLNSLGILDTMEEINANTQDNQLAGALAVKEFGQKYLPLKGENLGSGDANKCTTSTKITIGTPSNWTNLPTTSHGVLEVKDAGYYILQQYTTGSNDRRVYFRFSGSMGETWSDWDELAKAINLNTVINQLGKIKYTEITGDNNVSHFQCLKDSWESLELNRVQLVMIATSTRKIALVQKYHIHDYGSAIIFGYGEVPQYVVISNKNWVDYGLLAMKSDLANYLPLSGGELTNTTAIKRSDAVAIAWILQNANRNCQMFMGASGAFGLYDGTNDKWLLRFDANSYTPYSNGHKVLTSADFVVTGSANEATLTINLD